MRVRMSWATMSWATKSWATLAALLLAAISVAVTLSLIDYPLGVAWDELVKLRGVRTGRYAYYRPLIDLAQAAALVVHPADLPSLAQLVRVLGALAGGVMVFATFSLARLVLPNLPALAAAAATAVTPLLHRACPPFQGGYFCRGLPRARARRADQVAAGACAASRHPARSPRGTSRRLEIYRHADPAFAIIAILIVRTPGPERRWLRAATVTGISIGTFLLLMLPAIRRIDRWRRGVNFELTHSMLGHDVPLALRLTWGLFHLRESLWPGLGTPLFALGLVGLAAPLIAARERRMPLLLIASFTLLWYAVHEATPLKPFPDFSRYMLPLVPLLIMLAASFIHELLSRWDRRGAIAAIAVLLAAVPALSMSLSINSPDADPRNVVPPIVAASGARAVFDRYSDYQLSRTILGLVSRPTKDVADIVVTSNLAYDRFDFSVPRKGSNSAKRAAYYRELSSRPHLDVSNRRPTLAYFNPVVRIVALDGSVARLEKIAADVRAAAPGLTVRLIDSAPNSKE